MQPPPEFPAPDAPAPISVTDPIGKAGIRSLAFTLAQELKPEGIRVGTVTVCGFVSAEDPKYNPPAIAEEFWKLYSRPKQQEVEIVY